MRYLQQFRYKAFDVIGRLRLIATTYVIIALIGGIAGHALYASLQVRGKTFGANPGLQSSINRTYINDLVIFTESSEASLAVGESTVIESTIKAIPPELLRFNHSSRSDIGVPNISLREAFGPGYEVAVKASLSASSFDIDPKDYPLQLIIEGGSAHFYWTTTPKFVGNQVISITFTGIWTGAGKQIERPLAHQTIELNIEPSDVSNTKSADNDRFMQRGHIEIGEVLTTLIGGLALPAIVWLVVRSFRKVRSRHHKGHSKKMKK